MEKIGQLKILFKKEFLSIIRDRRSLITSIIFTLLITPLVFGMIHFVQTTIQDSSKNQILTIAVKTENQNEDLVKSISELSKVKIKTDDDPRKLLKDGKVDSYLDLTVKDNRKVINYVYDETSNVSSNSLYRVEPVIQNYINKLRTNALTNMNLKDSDINPAVFIPETLQQVTGEKSQDSLFLFFIPYLVILGLIQSSIQYALELTAGEKERNTLATTLSLNTSPVFIGLSKILVTIVLSLFFSVLNFVGVVISFTLFSDPSVTRDVVMNLSTVLEVLAVIIPLSMLSSSLMIILGIFSRNMKEGGIYSSPIILAAIFIAFTGTAFDVNTSSNVFAIPVIGHVAALKQILLGKFSLLNYSLVTISTIVLFILLTLLAARLFKSEKVLFRK